MPKEREGGGGGEGGEGECERRKKVGHYVLGPCLGEGSFAKVRTGTHILSREKVAVKVVSKRLIIRREAARRNFRREALLLQHVRHPHIVCLLEAMETAHSYYLVFELAPNGNLLTYLTERKCLREAEARRLMRQIVSAVDHLHRSFIVHRDLKLENCLLNANWDIKIIDFGLSALCQRESGLHTQCGSPAYAAPEIFGNRRYGPAVDLWSIGVCLYAMVVGRLPFLPHPPTNLTQLHALILKGPSIPTFLSTGLQQLLSGLLEVQESRRLSVSDLLSHSWLTCNQSQPITRYPPVSQAPPPPVDTQVVRYMSRVFRFSESDVIHSVTERKLNASSATYHLLKRHMEGERSAEETESEEGRKEEEDSGGGSKGGDASDFRKSAAGDNGKTVASNSGKSIATGDVKCVGEDASDAPTTTTTTTISRPVAASSADIPRLTASEYGRSSSWASRVDVVRPAVSEYSRPLTMATGCEGVERAVTSSSSSSRAGCPVLRSHILTPCCKSPSGGVDEAGAERRRRRERETFQDYKQCILYLKQARHHAFTLGGRPFAHLHPHFLDRTSPSSSKLPLLSLHRSLPPPPLSALPSHHGHQALSRTEGHQCSDGSGSQVKLNVLGRPALPERGKGGTGAGGDRGGDASALATYNQAPLTSLSSSSPQETGAGAGGPGRPPPAPPNTAHGIRVPPMRSATQPSFSETDPNSPRPSSSGSGQSLCSLRDPFSRDTWRAVLQQQQQQHDNSSPRLAGESEGVPGPRKWRGVSFVAPLSTPKTLTSREAREVSAGGGVTLRRQQQQHQQQKRHNYFLVRQLTADFNRRRVTPGGTSSGKKVTTVTPAAPTSSVVTMPPPPTPPTSPHSLHHHHDHHNNHHHHSHHNNHHHHNHHHHYHRHSQPLLLHDSSQRGEEEGREDRLSLGSSGDDGGFGEALETERFLTPVIRVTITSTAKP